jgi:hypothetical protein
MTLLTDIGLVEWVPHLIEGDSKDAETIHPLGMDDQEPALIENKIGRAAHAAGASMLTLAQLQWANSQCLKLVPVPRHLTNVQVVGIARLRYRPQTKMTAAWWADLQTSGNEFAARYLAMTIKSAASAS